MLYPARLSHPPGPQREGQPDTGEEDETVTLTLGDGSISAMNQLQDYMYRPNSMPFEDMCIYEYVGLTEKVTVQRENARVDRRLDAEELRATGTTRRGRPEELRGQFRAGHPQRDTHIVRKRVVWVVPVLLETGFPGQTKVRNNVKSGHALY